MSKFIFTKHKKDNSDLSSEKKKKNYSLKTLETSTLQSDALQKCNFTSTDYNSEVGLNLKNRFS